MIYTTQAETKALLHQSRQKSHLFASSLKAGIRNVMLSGRSSYVRSLIEETREEFNGIGRLRLFNNEGEEIFSETEKFIAQFAQDTLIRTFLDHELPPETGISNFLALENEESCHECHAEDQDLLGAMKFSLSQTTSLAGESLGHLANQAFNSIMLSGKGEATDELLYAISGLKGISRVQIYDNDGYYLAFGDDESEVPLKFLEETASKIVDDPSQTFQHFSEEHHETYIFPLLNDEKCQVCHGSDQSIMGMFAFSLDRSDSIDIELAEKIVIEGFKNMMVMERGMYASDYVDRVRKLPFVNEFIVFDNGERRQGGVHELYVPNPEFKETVYSDSVNKLILDVNKASMGIFPRMEYEEVLEDGETYLTQVIPFVNDEKCQVCHEEPLIGDPLYEKYGDRWKVRSVLEVSTSMAAVEEEIKRNIYASISVGIFTILLVGIILRIFIKTVVLTPLNIIGNTVGAVGEGNLGVSATIQSGDEIGILAERINTMIQGLRERLHLTKFVSHETVEAVKVAGLSGVALGGERKDATVLFSDIRGFTAYSERVDPEQVISMLNTFLNEQAQIVKQYGGDIDKFVGDELMAVFQGAEMVDKAIACGIALQQRIFQLSDEHSEPIHIGVGINTGSMVMGAMGSVDRMDYTVIGDSVNLGARLCSAAGPGKIIVSEQSVEHLSSDHSFKLEQIEPLSVKGKEKAIKVYSVGLG